jgi:hypothetical protein
MAQSNIITRERATFIGQEAAFGTTPAGSYPNAMTRVFPLGDGLILEGLAEEMLAVGDERVRRLDAIHPVHGLRIASKVGALKMLLKSTPVGSQLVDGATIAALTPSLVLNHALGPAMANEGDFISGTSSSTTVINVVDGTKFRKGTFIAVEVAGQMEFAKITNISTNALTIAPALSAAPATGGEIVRNLYNFAPADSHTNSLTIQQAFVGDPDAEYTANGCYGDVSFDLPEFGKLPSMSLALTATNFIGPSAQSPLAAVSASDEMGPAFAWAPSVYLATSVNRATRLVCEGATIEFANDWQMVRDPGATQTVAAVVNTGGRPTAVKATIKLRFDSQYKTDFTADTAYQMIIVQRIGTGTTASFWIWELPAARLVAQPKLADMGSRLHMELALEGIQDTTVTLGGTTDPSEIDYIKAPFRVAFG